MSYKEKEIFFWLFVTLKTTFNPDLPISLPMVPFHPVSLLVKQRRRHLVHTDGAWDVPGVSVPLGLVSPVPLMAGTGASFLIQIILRVRVLPQSRLTGQKKAVTSDAQG